MRKHKEIIKLKGIYKNYGSGRAITKVLHNISLSIHEGDFVAIMGASGSGKSTLMNILGFLDVPTKGSYEFNGKKVTAFDETTLATIRNEMIGFVFQSFYLLPRLSALENVQMPMIYANKKEEDQQERSKEVLTSLGLEDRIYYKPNELSGGQQQRVAIARALSNEPKIILADEPTGNVDSKSSKEIMEILQKLNKQDKTIILITHNKTIAKYANKIIKIKDGIIAKK